MTDQKQSDQARVQPTEAAKQRLKARPVAIIGYGSQGHAHAQNLKDSGYDVVVGLRAGSPQEAKAKAAGLRVATPAEAAKQAGLIAILIPDTAQRAVYEQDIAPHLDKTKTLLFAHGFNIHFGEIKPPAEVDVIMVAPKGPGKLVRREYTIDRGVPCIYAVHQDASGHAWDTALAYADGIGGTRAKVIKTTFKEETETDLFGEQAVLCGGVSELMKAGFETLVAAGYQPEIAYYECVHEMKLIVDLIYEGGLNGMRKGVSDTAEFGDYVAGERVVGDASRTAMKEILDDIQSGRFARRWIGESKAGFKQFENMRCEQREHPVEKVGATLRGQMAWMGEEHMSGFPATEWIWADGKIVRWQDATLHVMSHVVHYGSSVFEGMRVYGTEQGPMFFRYREHMRRLRESAAIHKMTYPYSDDELADALRDLIAKNGLESGAYIRPIVLRGIGAAGIDPAGSPVQVFLVVWNWGAYLGPDVLEKGVTAGVSSWFRPAPNTHPTMAKAGGNYINGSLMKVEAHNSGYDEAIALSVDGLVSEGSGQNIFLVKDGALHTPEIDGTFLQGITRDSVIKIADDMGIPVHQSRIPRESLYIADEVFFAGTASEVTPVRSVDKWPIGTGKRGPITTKIQERYMAIARGEQPDRHGWLTPAGVKKGAESQSSKKAKVGA